MTSRTRHFIRYALLIFIVAAWPSKGSAARIPPPIPAAVADGLSKGVAQDLIVLFDDSGMDAEAATLRQRAKKVYDDDSILALRRIRYRSIKQSTVAGFSLHEVEELRDYTHLPMSIIRVKSRSALDRLLADPRVEAIFEDLPVYPHLAHSLPFIGQPPVANAGITGNGQTVAVIDTGIDYTLSTFGSCSAPGVPSGCRVAASVDVTGNNVTLNQAANNHGTNVAGIVVGVAPGARIAAINAFSGGSSTTSWVIAGINWAIANKNLYNIGALNMSLGDSSNYTAPCGNSHTNPYVTPITNLRTAGIIPVASSGNSALTAGMASPACTPGVVSVGAVYDASWGGPYAWGGTPPTCTDTAASAPDKIPCFSNSASFLTILASGAFITAAGIQMAGTSQAAPHVAGAIAVVRAAYAGDTLDQAVTRLTSRGVSVTDSRNGITKPRLNLLAAVDATAPTVSLTTPASDFSVNGTVTVVASALDNIGVSKVEFYVNAVLTNTITADPYSFSWDTAAVANGTCTLSAKAYDAAGNVGQSGNVVVTVDNDLSPPTVSLTEPASGATVSGTITVVADASDNSVVSRVEFFVNGIVAYTGTAAPYNFSWDTTAVVDGTCTLLVKAYDAAGNVGQSGNVSVMVSQAEAVPGLSSWGMLVAVLCLAGMAGAANCPAACRKKSEL